ncbi:MAG: hypothetical protein WAO71_01380 [Gallionella sp.]
MSQPQAKSVLKEFWLWMALSILVAVIASTAAIWAIVSKRFVLEDGQTIVGIITFLFTLPVTFAAAYVVIKLGQRMDEQEQRTEVREIFQAKREIYLDTVKTLQDLASCITDAHMTIATDLKNLSIDKLAITKWDEEDIKNWYGEKDSDVLKTPTEVLYEEYFEKIVNAIPEIRKQLLLSIERSISVWFLLNGGENLIKSKTNPPSFQLVRGKIISTLNNQIERRSSTILKGRQKICSLETDLDILSKSNNHESTLALSKETKKQQQDIQGDIQDILKWTDQYESDIKKWQEVIFLLSNPYKKQDAFKEICDQVSSFLHLYFDATRMLNAEHDVLHRDRIKRSYIRFVLKNINQENHLSDYEASTMLLGWMVFPNFHSNKEPKAEEILINVKSFFVDDANEYQICREDQEGYEEIKDYESIEQMVFSVAVTDCALLKFYREASNNLGLIAIAELLATWPSKDELIQIVMADVKTQDTAVSKKVEELLNATMPDPKNLISGLQPIIDLADAAFENQKQE